MNFLTSDNPNTCKLSLKATECCQESIIELKVTAMVKSLFESFMLSFSAG